jgi:outer membrane protein
MKVSLIRILVLISALSLLVSQKTEAQSQMIDSLPSIWTLEKCVLYARENNIDVRSKRASKESSDQDILQAKANMYPSLSFKTNQGVNFSNTTSYNEYMEESDKVTYTGSYNIGASITLFNGMQLNNTVKQKTLLSEASQYNIEQTLLDLEISVTKAYLQILYDREALEVNKKSEELSNYQVKRGEVMYQAGSISKGDLAQLKSKHAGDKYNVVTAEKALSVSKLTLKQLLELEINYNMELAFPEIGDEAAMVSIPELRDVYDNAVVSLPQMRSSEKSIQAAQKAIDIAKGAYYPSISLTAGVSTGALSTSNDSYFEQLSNKLGENVGVSISVPIYSNRQIKTSVNKAKIQSTIVTLEDENYRKNLLSTIESLYNEAVNAQSQFISANEQLEASQISYNIINEQFSLGLKNTVDLITEENSYIEALSQKTQAKYRTIFAVKILSLYKNC